MKRILAAVDGSEPSLRAAQMAADLAMRYQATLKLVHVIAPIMMPPEGYGVWTNEMDKVLQDTAKQVLAKTADQVKTPQLRLETEVIQGGGLAERISDTADADKADLVVVGSTGRGAVQRLLLGSVSGRLVHICKKPLLVVR